MYMMFDMLPVIWIGEQTAAASETEYSVVVNLECISLPPVGN